MYPTARTVIDTVVLRCFLFVDRAPLLLDLLGAPIAVPRLVYDPNEGQVPERAMSELTRSMLVQERMAADPARPSSARADARRNAQRLATIHTLHQADQITVVDLAPEERAEFARLTSRSRVKELGLRFPLDPGEAACVAVAVQRQLTLATDDADALTALASLRPQHPYQRIRRLLRQASEQGRISRQEANAIHAEMRRLGFWDTGRPFPRA